MIEAKKNFKSNNIFVIIQFLFKLALVVFLQHSIQFYKERLSKVKMHLFTNVQGYMQFAQVHIINTFYDNLIQTKFQEFSNSMDYRLLATKNLI